MLYKRKSLQTLHYLLYIESEVTAIFQIFKFSSLGSVTSSDSCFIIDKNRPQKILICDKRDSLIVNIHYTS